jgi:hypothetical protein
VVAGQEVVATRAVVGLAVAEVGLARAAVTKVVAGRVVVATRAVVGLAAAEVGPAAAVGVVKVVSVAAMVVSVVLAGVTVVLAGSVEALVAAMAVASVGAAGDLRCGSSTQGRLGAILRFGNLDLVMPAVVTNLIGQQRQSDDARAQRH